MDRLARDIKPNAALSSLADVPQSTKAGTYDTAGDAENRQIHESKDDLLGRGEVLPPVHEEPENAAQAV